jgi:peptidyl-prolyl cis-trans isomerase A (cyclophilin A)
MKKILAALLAAGLTTCMLGAQAGQEEKPAPAKPAASQIKLDQPPGLYAVFDTTMGRIVCRLFPDKAPQTVKNFVGLANGTKKWASAKQNAWVQRRFYDGLTFHRVIPDFMIQGGDQLGNGRGGVGYTFKDEFRPDLQFDKPGKLAMANAGPNTNGSQFFITVVPTPHLNNHHTIFGEVVEGQDVADAISQVPHDANDKPNTPVVMKKLTIVEVK